ncbi:hypothetical protein K437DRAFT_224959 [Tilletiaria anomala UBC 951]|uniref:RNase III domain-containing protein n=1 Tax=Tilletiaria anomala (strain ATCC 24038 / CBS 436.72 / UBC 951) TaxID=1037660 RepID=A0A066VW38_TILAU|nr:uncharacterized protein K437DRAFT_224959 [Tilletiaria anomala UBC 951]KDN44498.1 hypothetical protein K437DRAFT_224959 [Tilletiaria anomala UBC 951]
MNETRLRPPGLSDRSITPQTSVEELQDELRNSILPGFPLPDSVALQMVSHESWDYGKSLGGHNRRLSFLGRRALKAFLMMFFHCALASPPASSSSTTASQRTKANELVFAADARVIDELLHTSALGQGAGSSLRLERVMRWTPALLPPSSSTQGPQSNQARESGLFKIRGICLEAIVGAIYHQHGAHMAQLFFQSQILPVLQSKNGDWPRDVPSFVREEALKAADRATSTLNDIIAKRDRANASSSIGKTQHVKDYAEDAGSSQRVASATMKGRAANIAGPDSTSTSASASAVSSSLSSQHIYPSNPSFAQASAGRSERAAARR